MTYPDKAMFNVYTKKFCCIRDSDCVMHIQSNSPDTYNRYEAISLCGHEFWYAEYQHSEEKMIHLNDVCSDENQICQKCLITEAHNRSKQKIKDKLSREKLSSYFGVGT